MSAAVSASVFTFGAEYGLGGGLESSSTVHRSALLITEMDDTSSATFHLEDPDVGDYFVVSICELTESILTAGCFLPTTGCWCLESSCPRSRAAPLAPLHHRRLHEDAASFGTLRWSVPPFTYSF